jgi:hypothetical protein
VVVPGGGHRRNPDLVTVEGEVDVDRFAHVGHPKRFHEAELLVEAGGRVTFSLNRTT